MRNAPWTIWRSCSVELWRLVILSTVFLVTVLAFAAAVRFIANGSLGPIDTLVFMSWAVLPMLQYALPFAGGFGATLAYHRMAQDNELVAAGGGGVSHRAILVPALASGIILAGTVMVLASEVIPGYIQRMERMVARDVSRMILNSFESGQAVRLSNLAAPGLDRHTTMVHADTVRSLGPDPERGVYERFALTGVAAVVVNDDGAILSEATARSAMIAFAQVAAPMPIGGADDAPTAPSITHVVLEMRNAFYRDERDGDTYHTDAVPFHWGVHQVFRDKPKYLSNRELAQLPQNPGRLNHIDNTRRDLASRIAEGQAIRDLNTALAQHGRIDLRGPEGVIFVVWASGLQFSPADHAWMVLPAQTDGRVEVERYNPAQGAARSGARYSARTAALSGESIRDILDRRIAFTLSLHEVRGRGPGAEAAGEVAQLSFARLAPPTDPVDELLRLPLPQLTAETHARIAAGLADAPVVETLRKLEREVDRVEREVLSRIHERWASSAACLVMVLAGAVTAMRLGRSLPLTVYLWSFFPALFAVLTIAAGQHITHQMGEFGLFVLWSGVGILALYTLGAFWLVRRN